MEKQETAANASPTPTASNDKIFPSYRMVFQVFMDMYGEKPYARPVSFLVSAIPGYLSNFQRMRQKCPVRDWVLDSGAFTVAANGGKVDLVKFTEQAKQLLAEDPQLSEVFALDVIGDWRAGLKNYEYMWKMGVPAIPTYHVGEPESVLLGLAKDYPKIALGGAVGYHGKDKWAAQCFARVYPKKIHGLGFGSEKSLLHLPFHTVDSSNWMIPARYGRWRAFGKEQLRVRALKDYSAEIEFYLDLEEKMRFRWAGEMKRLDELEANANGGVRQVQSKVRGRGKSDRKRQVV